MQESALYTITNGLYVLSAQDGNKFAGSLVDAVSQIAVTPYLVMVSCMNNSYTKECIEKTGKIGISVLPKSVEPFVVANFGYQSSRYVDKWHNVSFVEIDGLVYLSESLAKICLKVVQKMVYTSNTVFIGEVVDAFDTKSGEPLTYKYYRDGFKEQAAIAFNAYKAGETAGSEKCAAIATGVKPATEKMKSEAEEMKTMAEKHWVCRLCGYVYEGEIPFEELPDDWRCPLCGVGKNQFELR